MKVALIRAKRKSDWLSCQSIIKNLQMSYEKSMDIHVIELEGLWNIAESLEAIKEAYISGVRVFSLIDSSGDMRAVLKAIHCLNKEDIRIIVHIYGDFIFYSREWGESFDIIKKLNIEFICASESQKRLLRSCLNKGRIHVVPFPVDEDVFSIKDSIEKSENTLNLVYTGRLHIQKNITEVIRVFHYYQSYINPNSKLTIVGVLDSIGFPYAKEELLIGGQNKAWDDIFQAEPKLKESIEFTGKLSHEEIRDRLFMSDVFISLSTYNDEDYGMSVAEALMMGLPCLLSDWGGHSSFKDALNSQVELTPVSIETFLPQRMESVKLLSQFSKLTKEKRSSNRNQALEYLSIEAVSKKLHDIVRLDESIPNNGWNEALIEVSRELAESKNPFLTEKGDYNDLYKSLYRSYISESDL